VKYYTDALRLRGLTLDVKGKVSEKEQNRTEADENTDRISECVHCGRVTF